MATELDDRRSQIEDEAGISMYQPNPLWNHAEPVEAERVPAKARQGEHQEKLAEPQAQPPAAPDSVRLLNRTQLDDFRFHDLIEYDNDVSLERELPLAREALGNATRLVEHIFSDIGSSHSVPMDLVEQAVTPLVASILRNPDAVFWLDALRKPDDYALHHALTCSMLAAAFARQAGFDQDTVVSLAAGGLLMDLGNGQLPASLLSQPRALNVAEMEQMRTHVPASLDMVQASGITDPDVLDSVHTHHERFDGTGYPQQLLGHAIPVPGQMLGIVDAYHAMISVRPYRAPKSRHHALRELYAARGTLFASELVEQFQTCMGVYPTGSLVQLNTGQIALVMAQNRKRLRPRIVMLCTPERVPLSPFRTIDLAENEYAEDAMHISRSLAIDEFDFDSTELLLK